MNTVEMVTKVDQNGKTYSSNGNGSMRYQRDKGFHQSDGAKWPANAFTKVDQIFAIDTWRELEPLKVTMEDIREKFGRDVEIIGE